jgi:cytoskeleton protein RodZ
MADIGAMLREARMRASLDVSEIEARTKIRAKYLRALENEEWNLLPGPTFTKSFLRTYAEALGLDARLLVEEFKLRHERLSDVEMQPIVPAASGSSARRSRAPAPVIPRWALAGAGLVALIVLLAVLGSGGNGGPKAPAAHHPVAASTPAASSGPSTALTALSQRRSISLRLVPTASVYVCLLSSTGRRLINGAILAPGSSPPTFHSKSFQITLGNGSIDMFVDGQKRTVPQSSNGIGYEITARGRRTLALGKRPTCA